MRIAGTLTACFVTSPEPGVQTAVVRKLPMCPHKREKLLAYRKARDELAEALGAETAATHLQRDAGLLWPDLRPARARAERDFAAVFGGRQA